MPSRSELKFVLGPVQQLHLRERLASYWAEDSHVQRRGRYPVMSRYYDTDSRYFYWQKIEGEYDHVKIRARKYTRDLDDGAPGFLEAKIKHHADQRKIRVPMAVPGLLDPETWPQYEAPEVGAHDMDFFVDVLARTELFATCNVFFERQALELRTGRSGASVARLNFDTDILALLPDETRVTDDLVQTRRVLAEGACILEVKTPAGPMPDLLRNELRALDVHQTTFSKYTACLEFLDQLQQSWSRFP